MSAKKYWVKALVVLWMVLLVGVTSSQAARVNWTETLFTVSDGNLIYEWDATSQYELVYFMPSVQIDQVEGGIIYEFLIPNFYDPLPMKTVEITMIGANSGASGLGLVKVLNIIGSDSLYGGLDPAVPVQGMFVNGTSRPGFVFEQWEMFPNPDFEYVKVWAPFEFELQSVTIVTESVPLPGAVWLLGSGLLGLIGFRRKWKR